ncbi:MAG: hypothetical protein V4616_05545 [Bacteroidota bacterium]
MIKLGLVIDYSVNRVYITQAFCVNKAKPQLKCNGKCHLAKELKKAGEEKNDSDKNSKAEWLVFIGSTPIQPSFSAFESENTPEYLPYTCEKPSDYTSASFHPPAVG